MGPGQCCLARWKFMDKKRIIPISVFGLALLGAGRSAYQLGQSDDVAKELHYLLLALPEVVRGCPAGRMPAG